MLVFCSVFLDGWLLDKGAKWVAGRYDLHFSFSFTGFMIGMILPTAKYLCLKASPSSANRREVGTYFFDFICWDESFGSIVYVDW